MGNSQEKEVGNIPDSFIIGLRKFRKKVFSIRVVISFETNNGLLGMNRDAVFHLCEIITHRSGMGRMAKDRCIRTMMGISQEQIVWTKHNHFIKTRVEPWSPAHPAEDLVLAYHYLQKYCSGSRKLKEYGVKETATDMPQMAERLGAYAHVQNQCTAEAEGKTPPLLLHTLWRILHWPAYDEQKKKKIHWWCTVVFHLVRLFVQLTRSMYNRRWGYCVLHTLLEKGWVEPLPPARAVVESVFYYRTLIGTMASYVTVCRGFGTGRIEDTPACRAAEVEAGLSTLVMYDRGSETILRTTFSQLETYGSASTDVRGECDRQLITVMIDLINTGRSSDFVHKAILFLRRLGEAGTAVCVNADKDRRESESEWKSRKTAIGTTHVYRLMVECGLLAVLMSWILYDNDARYLLSDVCVRAKAESEDNDNYDFIRNMVLSSGVIPPVIRTLEKSRSTFIAMPLLKFLTAITDADTTSLPSPDGSTGRCLEALRKEGGRATLERLSHRKKVKRDIDLDKAIQRILSIISM